MATEHQKWARKFDVALAADLTRINRLRSHESKARAIRLALTKTREHERTLTALRDEVIVTLVSEYSWPFTRVAKYFSISPASVGKVLDNKEHP